MISLFKQYKIHDVMKKHLLQDHIYCLTLEECVKDYPDPEIIRSHPKYSCHDVTLYIVKYGHQSILNHFNDFIDSSSNEKYEYLLLAIKYGHLNLIKQLISAGCSVWWSAIEACDKSQADDTTKQAMKSYLLSQRFFKFNIELYAGVIALIMVVIISMFPAMVRSYKIHHRHNRHGFWISILATVLKAVVIGMTLIVTIFVFVAAAGKTTPLEEYLYRDFYTRRQA